MGSRRFAATMAFWGPLPGVESGRVRGREGTPRKFAGRRALQQGAASTCRHWIARSPFDVAGDASSEKQARPAQNLFGGERVLGNEGNEKAGAP